MHRLTATDTPMVRYTRTIFPSYAISNVMDYLYNDVTKFNHGLLFDNSVKTYDGLYETMTECTSVLNGNVDDSTVGVGKRLFESVLNKEIVDELFDQDVENEQGTQD